MVAVAIDSPPNVVVAALLCLPSQRGPIGSIYRRFVLSPPLAVTDAKRCSDCISTKVHQMPPAMPAVAMQGWHLFLLETGPLIYLQALVLIL